jgi:hypothetical protein
VRNSGNTSSEKKAINRNPEGDLVVRGSSITDKAVSKKNVYKGDVSKSAASDVEAPKTDKNAATENANLNIADLLAVSPEVESRTELEAPTIDIGDKKAEPIKAEPLLALETSDKAINLLHQKQQDRHFQQLSFTCQILYWQEFETISCGLEKMIEGR